MKIQMMSDLHLEFAPFELPHTDADILVLAGDISTGTKGIDWCLSLKLNIPILYILGNHEFYKSAYPKLIVKLKDRSKGSNVHVLENDSFTLDDVSFLACTLWTDFGLCGNPVLAQLSATQFMNDYKLIRKSPQYSRLRTSDTHAAFRASIYWLENQLQVTKGKTIVITHHAPSQLSIPDIYKNSTELNPSFASNLEDFIMNHQPNFWIHGHIHSNVSYTIGKTRVLCNPRGYPTEKQIHFDPQMIIEI